MVTRDGEARKPTRNSKTNTRYWRPGGKGPGTGTLWGLGIYKMEWTKSGYQQDPGTSRVWPGNPPMSSLINYYTSKPLRSKP